MPAALTFQAAAISDTGLSRENNEDSVYSGRWLHAVADGMGGHAAGEVASAAVITALSAYDAETPPDRLLEILGRAVAEANAEVARQAAEDRARLGMGTTLAALLLSGDRAALVNIGDSRAFRLRDGHLRQITEDHVIGKLVSDAGDYAPVLARYLDGRPDRSPDLSTRDLRPGDRYLLCSDGLSPVVSARAIRDVLMSAPEPELAAAQLAALAEAEGGPDNASAIVIDVSDGAAAPGAVSPVILGAAAEAMAR